MTPYVFPPAPIVAIPVVGADQTYPVRRIFCVGRNYVAHAAEMGGEVDREAPWYFTKSPSHAVRAGGDIPFAQGTENYHFEMEFVAALGPDASVFGYGCGLDMTRRDLQQVGKDNRRPWDLGKDVEAGAVLGDLTVATDVPAVGPQAILLWQNGSLRQDALLSDMVWSVPEIIAHLSGFYQLGAGDVIMTGTPAGVGAVQRGDTIKGEITGLAGITACFI